MKFLLLVALGVLAVQAEQGSQTAVRTMGMRNGVTEHNGTHTMEGTGKNNNKNGNGNAHNNNNNNNKGHGNQNGGHFQQQERQGQHGHQGMQEQHFGKQNEHGNSHHGGGFHMGGKGSEGRHGHGHQGGHMKMPGPPFLRNENLTNSARIDFWRIALDHNLTIAQQKDEINAWAANNSIQTEVTAFFNKVKQIQQNTTEFIATLVQKNQQLQAIFNDETQTVPQLIAAIKAYKQANRQAFIVLMIALKVNSHSEHMGNGTHNGTHHSMMGMQKMHGMLQGKGHFMMAGNEGDFENEED